MEKIAKRIFQCSLAVAATMAVLSLIVSFPAATKNLILVIAVGGLLVGGVTLGIWTFIWNSRKQQA